MVLGRDLVGELVVLGGHLEGHLGGTWWALGVTLGGALGWALRMNLGGTWGGGQKDEHFEGHLWKFYSMLVTFKNQ